MHKLKKSVRGYNQSELIAKEIAKKMNLKLEQDILKLFDLFHQNNKEL